jgi:hypothetical protein
MRISPFFLALAMCAFVACAPTDNDMQSNASPNDLDPIEAPSKPTWSEGGTNCYAQLNESEQKHLETILRKFVADGINPYAESVCMLPDGTRWIVFGKFGNDINGEPEVLHLSSTGAMIARRDSFSTEGGDIDICNLEAMRGDRMVFECGNGDAGWGRMEVFVYDYKTKTRTDLAYYEAMNNIGVCDGSDNTEVCDIQESDYTRTEPGCSPIARADAKTMADTLKSSALGVLCTLDDGTKIVTFTRDENNDGTQKKTAVALLSSTGGIISMDESFGSKGVPDTLLAPPKLIRRAEGRYFFVSHVDTEIERHEHVYYVDPAIKTVQYLLVADEYRNVSGCESWGDVCDNK